MALTLAVVQALAPEQSVLASAGKLLPAKHWGRVARNDGFDVIWGECQGSGANPYLVVADVADHGYKCTCPSRKFPCKHALALMWKFAETPEQFGADEPPAWVQEWLGRRKRGGARAAPGAPGEGPAKDLDAARAAGAPEAAPSAEELEKRAKAAERRRQQSGEAVRAGLDDLRQWVQDQLRAGAAAFVDDAAARCRRIAARLNDAKAAVLASRVDELPSRLLALPRECRAEAALLEFGQWTLLARAWAAAPDDADARADLLQAPTRDAVLAEASALRVRSTWEVVGNRVETRRDGLVSQATWLLDLGRATPRFALLLDFFPASAGRRTAAFVPGQRFAAELTFYPGRYPLRAVVSDGQSDSAAPEALPSLATPPADPLAAHREHLARVPWAMQTPLLLGPGRLLKDAQGQLWWPLAQDRALRVAPLADDAFWRGATLHGAVALWNGFQATLLRLDTALGSAWPDD